MAMPDIHHFVNGQTLVGTSGRYGDIFNPNTGVVAGRVQLASAEELDAAVQAGPSPRAPGPGSTRSGGRG